MSFTQSTDWNPEIYGRFRDLRLQPAHDLLSRVGELPAGEIVDLGCGAGAAAGPLTQRFADRTLVGIDNSPAMLGEAAVSGLYDVLLQEDVAQWSPSPSRAPALIYSNAALHWLGDHQTLFHRLADTLAPLGTLAVQMPRQYDAPSHVLLRELAEDMFPERFDFSSWHAPVDRAEDYARLLWSRGMVTTWETTYVQSLAANHTGHSVRRFTESTVMRPFLLEMSDDEAELFCRIYDAELEKAYPAEEDGSVLFPFTRVFIILELS